MEKRIISSPKAPGAIGPYSQATGGSGLLFVSGQLPVNAQTGEIPPGGIKEQTQQSLRNVKHILEEAGSSLEKVMKATVYLKDIADFAAMNEVYAQFFAKDCPARSAFQVAALPKGALVEIEVIALA